MDIATNASKHGPLQGLKVIDLTRMLPGLFGTMLLADLGAEVIVVEQPSEPALDSWSANP
jgi:alpha-methylacyl-CoA racemase